MTQGTNREGSSELPRGTSDVSIPPDAWENPLVVAINRLPARSAAWPHPDAESAATGPGASSDSPWVRCLSGTWQFHWVNQPDRKPVGFESPNFDDSSWGTIPVPGCVELYGHGTPIYLNERYPFKTDPPRVMGTPPEDWTTFGERNPVSSFRRWFEVPAGWLKQRVYLHIGAAGSCISVWINGKTIGFSKDSRLSAEFDISAAMKPGQNLITLQVLRYCDGSYLEDQDIWRLSGIFRDIHIFTRPTVHLWDVSVETRLDAALVNAAVRLRCQVCNDSEAVQTGVTARLTLRDPTGRCVEGFTIETVLPRPMQAGEHIELVSAEGVLTTPLKWSHETPSLYTAVVELVQNGRTLEAVATRIGIRTISLSDDGLTLNGVSIKLRGVNRHDWHPITGYVVDEATMRDDIRRIKQANLNAVRASHYPNDPRFVELCDEMGLLLLDEANVESHGLSYHKCVLPGDLPEWEPAVVECARRMVIRDCGHASVVMWSLGNEAGYGEAFEVMAAEVCRLDHERRPIQYADMNVVCDVDSQTYPSPQWLLDHLAGKAVRKSEQNQRACLRQHGPYPSGKPFLMNEYCWSGGNSLGNYQEYWEILEAHRSLIGGFVWDWADKGLAACATPAGNRPLLSVAPTPPRPDFHALGGDFGDVPNDGHYVLNGLLNSDRSVKPQYREVAKVHRPIRVRPVALADGRICIENRYQFLDLSTLVASWEWTRDGISVSSGTLGRLSCRPGDNAEAVVPRAPGDGEGEYYITLSFTLAEAATWADAGFVVAWDQLALAETITLPCPKRAPGKAVDVSESEESIRVSGREFSALVGRKSGMIESLRYGGRELIRRPFRLAFSRPATAIDRGWEMAQVFAPWRLAGENSQATEVRVDTDADGHPVIRAAISIPVGTSHAEVTYSPSIDGTIAIDCSVSVASDSKADELARVGMTAGIARELSNVTWLGLGPDETYPDRLTSGRFGLFRDSALRWNHPYQPPQETGHRCGVRIARITDANGRGMLIQAIDRPFELNLWPWTLEDLEQTRHCEDLVPRDFMTLFIDGAMMGLGGENGWGGRPLDQYRLRGARTYRFSVAIRPV